MTTSPDLRRRVSTLVLTSLLIAPVQVTPATIVVVGGCSLADAITAANDDTATGGCASGSGADEIVLTKGVLLGSALPEIANTSVITLRGNGFTVRRHPLAPDFGIFYVQGNGDLTIDNATIAGGAGAGGSGIFNRGALTVHNSEISDNHTTGSGGGIANLFGQVTLTHSTLSGNSALFGGGLYSLGYADIFYSRFDSNVAESRGGGIANDGSLLMERSAVTNNLVIGGPGAPGHNAGGGIFLYYGNHTLISSTISGNTILEGNGGGIMAYYSNLTLTNTTVAANSAASGGAIFEYFSYPTLKNSVVSGICSGYYFQDGGNNFGCGFGVLTGFDGTLADHGGPTPTHALLAGSSAIDAAVSGCTGHDQRAFGRNGVCDSGAFEFEGLRPAIGGEVSGLDTFSARCINATTAMQFDIPLAGATSWDCEDAGLVAAPSDSLRLVVAGMAISEATPIRGAMAGMRFDGYVCKNASTDQMVSVRPAGLATDWNCTTAGLVVAPGDRVRLTAIGSAD